MQDYEMNGIWKKVTDLLAGEISEVSLKTWILPMKPVYADDKIFILSVPDSFSYTYVIQWQNLIVNTFSIVCSRTYEVRMAVKDSQEIMEALRRQTSPTSSDVSSAYPEEIHRTAAQMNPQYTFEAFVVGSGNRTLAYQGKFHQLISIWHYISIFIQQFDHHKRKIFPI